MKIILLIFRKLMLELHGSIFHLVKGKNIFAWKQSGLFPRRKFPTGLPGSAFCTQKTTTGFTLLFAVIVSSLVLALGLGIVAITMKEVRLSSSGRDSQLAFYAADSGLECGEYYDIVKSAFATSTESANPYMNIICNNLSFRITSARTPVDAVSTFWMFMEHVGGAKVVTKPCAFVSVHKYMDGGQKKTTIDSRGYSSCDTTNTRRLERGYRVEYISNE